MPGGAGMSEQTYLDSILALSTSWRVFPCRDKKPLTPHGLKDATQDQNQIRDWWTRWPDAQIGVPVGENTDSFVLDIDLPDGPASLAALEAEHGPLPATWTATTPSGGTHLHFALPAGVALKNSAGRLGKDLDIRTEGGYVIVAPTPGYVWTSGKTPRANAPEWLLKLLSPPQAVTYQPPVKSGSTTPYGRSALNSECARVALAPEGTRNHTLNASAFAIGQLVAGGQIDHAEGESALHHAALRSGLSQAEASKTISSGMGKGLTEPRQPEIVNTVNKAAFSSTPSTPSTPSTNVNTSSTVGQKSSTVDPVDVSFLVDEFIEQSSGIFTSSELCQWCGLTTREQRVAVSQALLRRIHKRILERVGARSGNFRRVERECESIDFLATPEPPVDITLPFGLCNLVELMPGNIVVVAGEPNAGKTAFLLNVIRENMHRSKVHYFNSEMGAEELRKRLSKFDMPLTAWTFEAKGRAQDFQDVIVPGPGNINIIDFLEVSEDFYKVGGMIKAIHDRLEGALAIIALQKNKGTDLGMGGGRSLEKPRLYLALEPGLIKIVKAKNWRTQQNPTGLQLKFKTVDGCKLIPQGDWHNSIENAKPRTRAA